MRSLRSQTDLKISNYTTGAAGVECVGVHLMWASNLDLRVRGVKSFCLSLSLKPTRRQTSCMKPLHVFHRMSFFHAVKPNGVYSPPYHLLLYWEGE